MITWFESVQHADSNESTFIHEETVQQSSWDRLVDIGSNLYFTGNKMRKYKTHGFVPVSMYFYRCSHMKDFGCMFSLCLLLGCNHSG